MDGEHDTMSRHYSGGERPLLCALRLISPP